jgi:hypothetical protein
MKTTDRAEKGSAGLFKAVRVREKISPYKNFM